uniref:Synaptonemal complex protein 1 n=1 Tax=Mastacembelus armatus TaxID=205130 RepID=A0A3Q3L2M0_9TELE
MERDRAFNFKLLVPPRVNNGQVSAVRPQETVENSGDFINTLQQGYSKCFDKEKNMPFPNTNALGLWNMCILLPVIVNVSQNNCNPGQLYSKLLDEVEKIKFWKVKVDSDTMQKERRLQENKRTIETQRKAIQELQFGNESLSIKLEEQISENADLRNKNSATRNLCNILKDTFQRSAEKMHLFESEREETHHLYMENSESIQKLIAAFESLRVQAEADQQEMQKVKEGLLHVEELNKKYHQEYTVKEKEVVVLQSKLKDKENELQKFLLDLHESQKLCKQLQETTGKIMIRFQHKLLLPPYVLEGQLFTETKKNQECVFQMEQLRKEIAQHNICTKKYILNCYKPNNKMLKKQIAKETLKSSQLERVINSLHEDSKNLKRLNEEDCQKLLKDLESTSTFAVELENQVQKLRVTEAEAIKKKEDAELKCQQKIADMVALMEKHKSQYDRMVEEKDAELEENKKKEMEAVAHRKSLVFGKDINEHLENLQKKLTDVKNEISSVNVCQLSDTKNKQVQKLHMRFIITQTDIVFASKDSHTEDLKTPRRTTDRVGGIYKIKSYRIMTPPPAENAECLGKSTIELDPKSDSSDLNDLWSFANAPTPSFSAPHYKVKKIQSPVTHKSPGNSLKLAAVKRMRDAGWTAVTGCDKKKKKTNEKIFA